MWRASLLKSLHGVLYLRSESPLRINNLFWHEALDVSSPMLIVNRDFISIYDRNYLYYLTINFPLV